jgi:hypothetical protein
MKLLGRIYLANHIEKIGSRDSLIFPNISRFCSIGRMKLRIEGPIP